MVGGEVVSLPAKINDGLTTSQRYYLRHTERSLASSKKWREANPDKERNKHYQRRFKIGIEEYNVMHDQQSGLCAICNQPETVSSKEDGTPNWLAVDHDHKTGKVRALLCFKCNTTLSYFEKHEQSIANVIDYLEKHK